MSYRILAITLLTLSYALNSYGDNGKSDAQRNLEVLDGLCVQNFEDFSNIKHMIGAFGGKPVPRSLNNGDPAMRKMGGESYMVTYEGKRFIVGYAEGGGCTVVTRNIDHKRLGNLLINNYHAKIVHTEEGGAQVSKMYQVTGKSLHKGALFSIVYGKRESGITEGSVGFIPVEIIKKSR